MDDGIIKPNAKGLKEYESVDWNNFIISFRNKICDELVRILLPILHRLDNLSTAFHYLTVPLYLIDKYKSETNDNIKYAISKNQFLPTNWIRKNLKYLDPIQIQQNQKLDEDILDKLAPRLNADIISEKQQLSRDWVMNNLINVNIRYIIYYQDFVDEDFIESLLKVYKDWSKIPWEAIIESIHLSENFIEKYWNYLPKDSLTRQQHISLKLIEKHLTSLTNSDCSNLLGSSIYKNREKRAMEKLINSHKL